MIVEGLKLMVIGMVIVYIFLIVLMLLVILSTRVLKNYSVKSVKPSVVSMEDNNLVTILSAAIAAYRSKRNRKS